MINMSLRSVRFELSRGAYIRTDTYGKKTDIGLYKTFYCPFERGVCLGYLNSRQFKTLLSSGFVTCCHVMSFEDGFVHSFYVAGGIVQ